MPALMPVTTPLAELTVPAAVLLLAHAPPAGVLLNVVVNPLQMTSEPDVVIVPGKGITVTTVLTAQPVLSIYDMVDVPAVTPVTMPIVPSAIRELPLELLHVPVAGVLFNVVVAPAQTVFVPVIVVGSSFTVTMVELAQPLRT